jgi:hypothetical protein
LEIGENTKKFQKMHLQHLLSGTDTFLQFVGKIHFLSPVISSPSKNNHKYIKHIKVWVSFFWNRLQSLANIDKATTYHTERRTNGGKNTYDSNES